MCSYLPVVSSYAFYFGTSLTDSQMSLFSPSPRAYISYSTSYLLRLSLNVPMNSYFIHFPFQIQEAQPQKSLLALQTPLFFGESSSLPTSTIILSFLRILRFLLVDMGSGTLSLPEGSRGRDKHQDSRVGSPLICLILLPKS